MKRFLTLLLILVTVCSPAAMRGGALYDPGAARSSLSNVDATATPSMTSITLSDKVRAAWADILGDIYASGTVKVATGTAAAPAYSFSSDPDTGIYSAGADTLGFGEGGAESMRITSGGNVLIATSTDDGANKLQVNGFTKLGDAATGIKMAVIASTTPTVEGEFTTIPFPPGVTAEQVVSYSVEVLFSGFSSVLDEHTLAPGYLFHIDKAAAVLDLTLSPTDSENILGKPIRAVIWYKE